MTHFLVSKCHQQHTQNYGLGEKISKKLLLINFDPCISFLAVSHSGNYCTIRTLKYCHKLQFILMFVFLHHNDSEVCYNCSIITVITELLEASNLNKY